MQAGGKAYPEALGLDGKPIVCANLRQTLVLASDHKLLRPDGSPYLAEDGKPMRLNPSTCELEGPGYRQYKMVKGAHQIVGCLPPAACMWSYMMAHTRGHV